MTIAFAAASTMAVAMCALLKIREVKKRKTGKGSGHAVRGKGRGRKAGKGERAKKEEESTVHVGSGERVFVRPIGVVRSCFRECRGTPRQGTFAPDSRGYIEFEKRVPEFSTIGLEKFSHLWVVFQFHNNTNSRHNQRAHASHAHSFRAKVRPPALNGKAVGVFATRSPHRPNPIGFTLVKMDAVKGRRIEISGLDLLDNTPVLDVKPYVHYDALQSPTVPAWCSTDLEVGQRVIEFSCEAENVIREAASGGQLRFYKDGEVVMRTLRQLFQTDVRPSAAYKKRSDVRSAHIMHQMRFDMLRIYFQRGVDGAVRVRQAVVETEDDEQKLQKGLIKRYEK